MGDAGFGHLLTTGQGFFQLGPGLDFQATGVGFGLSHHLGGLGFSFGLFLADLGQQGFGLGAGQGGLRLGQLPLGLPLGRGRGLQGCGEARLEGVDELLLLADAQTSGGLLLGGEVPGAPVIGEFVPRGEFVVVVR